MNIEYVDIKSVIPNPENPRIIKDENFEKLVNSIKDFPEMMNIRPIVVNQEMVTLGGNMRLRACKEAGLKKVPIIKTSLTKEQEREFIVKDNVGYGEWDWEMLGNEWDIDELNYWGLKVDLWKNKEEDEVTMGDDEPVQKNIMIPIKEEDYKPLMELIKFHRKRGAYVGGIVLKHLKAEKNKINM